MSRHVQPEGKDVKSVYTHNGNKSGFNRLRLHGSFLIERFNDSSNCLFTCQGYGGIKEYDQPRKEIFAEELSWSFSSGRDLDRTSEVCLTNLLVDPGADVPHYSASLVFQMKDPADVFSFVRRLAKWRKRQVKLLPHVANHVLKAFEEDLETVAFFLPSDLSLEEIEEHSLQKLLKEEISLHEAVLNEWLEKFCEATIHVDAAYGAKDQNACSQYENLHSNDGIKKLVAKQD
jgi:hypothetical protein